MKIKRNILRTIMLACAFAMISITNLSILIGNEIADNFSTIGYKPVAGLRTNIKEEVKLIDNLSFKEWCEETFDNGNYIYDAYRNIAFNLKYTSEPGRTDFWQTPIETTRLKRGDCEDAVLLFFSQIPSNQKNAEIVWGWVIDNQSKAKQAHVWYQLTDKKGQKYVVEGFSGDWKGIIPIRVMLRTETRKPILTISHCMVSILSRFVGEWQMCQTLADLFTSIDFINNTSGNYYFAQDQDMRVMLHLSELEFIEYSMNTQDEPGKNSQYQGVSSRRKETPRLNRETSNILKKLHEVFSRYENQKKDVGSTVWVSHRSGM